MSVGPFDVAPASTPRRAQTPVRVRLISNLPPRHLEPPRGPHSPGGDPLRHPAVADGSHNLIRRIELNGTITTIAGNGTGGFSGDGGPATSAALSVPNGVAALADGRVLFADAGNNRIRRIELNGTITTIAGNGTAGFSGDGGPATNARLQFPQGIALDAAGRVLIADAENHRIRRIDLNGTITTIAGNGTFSFSGDGGPATNAALDSPFGVAALADGRVLIADTSNSRIRRIELDGTIITIAGNGTPGFSGDGGPATSAALNSPSSVAILADGRVLIAESDNHRIRRIELDGRITTIAGNGTPGFSGDRGPAISASIQTPRGVAALADGSVLIADLNNNRIRRIELDGTITTIAGNGTRGFSGDGGPATSAALFQPHGIAVDVDGRVLIADLGNNRIRRIGLGGTITTIAGNGTPGFSGDGGPATSAVLKAPRSIAVLVDGRVVFADAGNNRIRRIELNGTITTIAGTGTKGFSGDGGPATSAALDFPSGIAVDADGRVLVADTTNRRIRRIELDGTITTIAGGGN